MSSVRRVYVEKKPEFAVQAKDLKHEIKNYLGIRDIKEVRILIRYDVENISDDTFEKACNGIFSEPPVDILYHNAFPETENAKVFSVEFLPGQFDQRADSAVQCIQFIKEDKCSIAVFPEGGTNRTEEDLLPFRNGAFKVAQKAQVPIVICALVNSKAILKNMFRRHTDVYLDVLDVIPPEQFAEQRTVEVGDRAHRILLEGLRKRKATLAAQ